MIKLPRPQGETLRALRELLADIRGRYAPEDMDGDAHKRAARITQECAEDGYSLDGWQPHERWLLADASHGALPVRGTVHLWKTPELAHLLRAIATSDWRWL